MYKDEIYYVFIEEHEEKDKLHEEEDDIVDKFVIRIYKNSNWHVEAISGSVPYDLENEIFDREDVIDDILEQLRNVYDYVQEISFPEIEDYMEEDN
jgi:hypothetical protein